MSNFTNGFKVSLECNRKVLSLHFHCESDHKNTSHNLKNVHPLKPEFYVVHQGKFSLVLFIKFLHFPPCF